MEKYVTKIKDLVISAMTMKDSIENKAKGGDPEACFQMGMIHLLGIEKPVNFKKAIDFFSRISLSSNSCALRLLGFLYECDKNYSFAFQNYVKAYDTDNKESSKTYVSKVEVERKNLYDYLRKIGLPEAFMNDEISKILDGYKKNKKQKLDACSMIATLCDDEPTCMEAAETVLKTGDLVTAKMWLNKGKVDNSNPIYEEIENKTVKTKKNIVQETELKVLDLEGDSLIIGFDSNKNYDVIKKTCDKIASESQSQWQKMCKTTIEPIIQKRKKEEHKLFLQEQREEEKRKKRKRLIIKHSILCVALFLMGVGVENASTGVLLVLGFYGWYFPIKWVIQLFKN